MRVKTNILRLESVMMLAGLVVWAMLSANNVQARDSNIQDVCTVEYGDLRDSYERGQWAKVYESAKRVRTCAEHGSLAVERVEFTYVAELNALGEMNRHEDLLQKAEEILDNRLVVERRDFIGFILEESAIAAYHLGRAKESLHYFKLAVYESQTRDLKARINLRRSLYLLHKRNHEFVAAGESIGEVEAMLHEHGEAFSVEERLLSTTMIAAFYYGRLIPRIRQNAGPLDTTRADVADVWSQARRYHHWSRSLSKKIASDNKTREDLMHGVRDLDLDVARLIGDRQDVIRLLAESNNNARESRAPRRLLEGLSTRARFEMDEGKYDDALRTIQDLEEAVKDYGLKSFMPSVLSYRVRVASHTGDREVAQRALDELANFDGSVPPELFQEASGQYASVFQTSTSPTRLPTWLLACLSLGIAGTLQFIVVTANRRQESSVLRAFTSPLMHFVQGGHWQIPSVLLGKTAQQGASVSVDPSLIEKKDPPAQAAPTETAPRTGGDGFALATGDAAWLREVGISVQDVPEIDAPPEVEPATLEDLLQKSLSESTSIQCYGPDGTKTDNLSLPSHIIEHATSDRFMGIELDDRLLIVYRYARPQYTMVKQDATGALRIVELDTPVTAIPIASIQREA